MGLFEHFPYTNFHELNIQWITRKLKELETELAALKARMDTAEARLDGIDIEIAAIKDRLDVIEADIVLIKNRLTAVENRATALENRMTAAEGRLDAIELDIVAIKNRLTALENRIEVKYYNYEYTTDPETFDAMVKDYLDGKIFPCIIYKTQDTASSRNYEIFTIAKAFKQASNFTSTFAWFGKADLNGGTHTIYVEVDDSGDTPVVVWNAPA